MTDTATQVHPAIDGEDGGAEPLGAELNGAVVLRTRKSRAAGPARPSSEEKLRARLERLSLAVDEELERRRAAAELEPADGMPVSVRELSSISRELPRLGASAPAALARVPGALRNVDVLEAASRLRGFLSRQLELAARARRGEREVDEFGFDVEWTESIVPVFEFLYRHYWRVHVNGLENIPGKGRALLVSNHAGVLPYDGAMIRVAIYLDHPTPRHARALILNQLFAVPIGSWFFRRTGNTLGHPSDAERLLERDELVLVFPEGAKGTGKAYQERYRLRRFGRGGFVQTALRTGSPIIPVSVVGSEELHPMIANARPIADLLGLPYFPVTPTFPWLGPLGLLPLPSSWIIEFHEPIPLDGYPADAADDAALVMQLADRVRDTIQQGLFRNLERRGSVFA
jgi:1-acyl-sn-glycerol-3-phosphate acyltransferase